MHVQVFRISIPPMSTVGYAFAIQPETGEEILFCGDHCPMRDLGEVLQAAAEPLLVEIEPWQVL